MKLGDYEFPTKVLDEEFGDYVEDEYHATL